MRKQKKLNSEGRIKGHTVLEWIMHILYSKKGLKEEEGVEVNVTEDEGEDVGKYKDVVDGGRGKKMKVFVFSFCLWGTGRNFGGGRRNLPCGAMKIRIVF